MALVTRLFIRQVAVVRIKTTCCNTLEKVALIPTMLMRHRLQASTATPALTAAQPNAATPQPNQPVASPDSSPVIDTAAAPFRDVVGSHRLAARIDASTHCHRYDFG
ncbi:MAG: hypothetical protein R3C28_19150 [Pirellulaceae bacterium]